MSIFDRYYCCVCDPEHNTDEGKRFCWLHTKFPGLEMLGIDHDQEDEKDEDHKIRMSAKRLGLFQLVFLLILGTCFTFYPYYSVSNFFVTDEYIADLGTTPDIKRELEFKRNQLVLEQERDRTKNQGSISEIINSLASVLQQNPGNNDANEKKTEAIKLIDDIIESQNRIERLSTQSAPIVVITTPVVMYGCLCFAIAFLTYHARTNSIKIKDLKLYALFFLFSSFSQIIGFCFSLATRAGGYESTRFMLLILIINAILVVGWNSIIGSINQYLISAPHIPLTNHSSSTTSKK